MISAQKEALITMQSSLFTSILLLELVGNRNHGRDNDPGPWELVSLERVFPLAVEHLSHRVKQVQVGIAAADLCHVDDILGGGALQLEC